MSKKLSIVSMTTVLLMLVAVTAAFSLSNMPKAHGTEGGSTILAGTMQPLSAHLSGENSGDGDREIKDDNEGKESDNEASDGPLTAKITPDQAKKAALAEHPGTAGKVELEDEDGTAVYGVEITAADGKKYDVKVDANTGKVLKSDANDNNEDNEGDNEGGE